MIRLILSGLVLTGCGSSGGSTPDAGHSVVFRVRVSLPDEIDEVRVDGVVHAIDLSEGRALVNEQEFSTYEEADSQPTTRFEFLSGTIVRNTGEAHIGVCISRCTFGDDICPNRDDLELELIRIIPLTNFSVGDFECATCSGGGGKGFGICR